MEASPKKSEGTWFYTYLPGRWALSEKWLLAMARVASAWRFCGQSVRGRFVRDSFQSLRSFPFISQSAVVLWGQNRLSEEVVPRKGVMQGKTCDDYQVQG